MAIASHLLGVSFLPPRPKGKRHRWRHADGFRGQPRTRKCPDCLWRGTMKAMPPRICVPYWERNKS